MKNNLPPLDILTIGETLIDFISLEQTYDGLRSATTFVKHLGGSPANIAVYAAKLGANAAVVSKTGVGAFGQFIQAELNHHGVDTSYLVMDDKVHTSFIFVSRSQSTPDFEPSRNGDFKLTPDEILEEAIERATVVHASTFAISREPCRWAVGKAFRLASEQGKIVSFDPNYSPVIWPNYDQAKEVIREMYRYANITKPSLDDGTRLFGPGYLPEKYIEMFHELGPKTVVLTMGKDGSLVSQDGTILAHVPARSVEVVDVTGAGDSFWAGFLVALLDGHPLEKCALFAREVVERKLTVVGHFAAKIDRNELYANVPPIEEAIKPWP